MMWRVLMAAGLVAVCGCRDARAPTSPRLADKSITADEATKIVWALPDVQARAAYIREHGLHAKTMEPQPVEANGRRYWEIRFFEDRDDHILTWEYFLVDVDSGEESVRHIPDWTIMSLDQWRAEHPFAPAGGQR